MKYEFISIGGWCGPKLAMYQAKILDEENLPFDYIRSSVRGIIDSIENNFSNYFPDPEMDKRFHSYKSFIGKHTGFFHNENPKEPSVIESINRKIARWNTKLELKSNIFFIRYCITPNYNSELEELHELSKLLKTKYPSINFRILFLVPDQPKTAYYKYDGDSIFVFAINDTSYNNNNLGNELMPLFTFIKENDLFEGIPESNSIELVTPTSRLFYVDGHPCINDFSKYI